MEGARFSGMDVSMREVHLSPLRFDGGHGIQSVRNGVDPALHFSITQKAYSEAYNPSVVQLAYMALALPITCSPSVSFHFFSIRITLIQKMRSQSSLLGRLTVRLHTVSCLRRATFVSESRVRSFRTNWNR